MRVRQVRSQSDPLQVGQLPDGTPFFAPLGELVRDGDERVQCHLCGRFMRIVGGTHIRVGHGWTLDAYREAFRLPQHEPTCAGDLSSRFRSDARARVGTKGFASPPADPPRRPKRTPAWRSLRNLRPDLAAELHSTRNGDIDADTLSAGSRRKVWWACSTCGHEWEAIVGNRTLRGSGCPVCSVEQRARSQSRVPPARSLATVRPDLAREVHPTRNGEVDPRKLGTGSNRTVWWECRTCGHEWQARVSARVSGTGCPRCWQRRRAQAPAHPI
jgi:rubrerythrin